MAETGPRRVDKGERRHQGRRPPRPFVGFIVIVVLVLGLLVALGVMGATVGLVLGFGWVSYEGLLLPALDVQRILVSFSPGMRLLMFMVWLAMTAVVSVVLVNIVGARIRYDNVAGVLAISALCVLFSIALTSWGVYAVIRVFGLV